MARPRINPDAPPMTPAERQRRHRAKLGSKTLNRVRRRKDRAKRAALRSAAREAKAATKQRRAETERDTAAAAIAALSATVRQLSNGDAVERRAPNITGLTGYTVETVGEFDALPLILQHEHLGTLGKPSIIVGLYSPERELQGVACFGHGPTGTIRQRIGSPALCLERGCCVPYAPPKPRAS